MSIIEAIILGIVQGLTEFLPVSSSGHLEIGKVILGVDIEESLSFTVAVHGATVLSTIAVFRKDILQILQGVLRFQWNDEMRFAVNICVSMIPVLLVGLFLKDRVESLFDGNLLLVGSMLLVTATLLWLTTLINPVQRKPIGILDSLIMGIAQAIAVLPGISRSGATIATGLIIGKNREDLARFSFLMSLVPIIGANILEITQGNLSSETGVGSMPILMGSIAAFISGYLACSYMLRLVRKGKFIWFVIYCTAIGIISILSALLG